MIGPSKTCLPCFLLFLLGTSLSAQAYRATEAPKITETHFKVSADEVIFSSFTITDVNENLDCSSLKILKLPQYGALLFDEPCTLKENFYYVKSFTYIPNKNFIGTDSVLISVCDTEGGCDSAYLYFDRADMNPPVAINDVVTLDVNGVVEGSTAKNDYDLDNNIDPLSYHTFSNTQLGLIFYYFNGRYFYKSNGKMGVDTVIYTVCDYTGLCDTGYLVFKVGIDRPQGSSKKDKSELSNTINTTSIGGFDLTKNNPSVYVKNAPNLFKAYPNPTKDLLNMSFEKEQTVDIELINALGQVLKRQQLSGITAQINLQDLQNGVYFLSAKTDDGQKTMKIVKE